MFRKELKRSVPVERFTLPIFTSSVLHAYVASRVSHEAYCADLELHFTVSAEICFTAHAFLPTGGKPHM